MNAKNKKKMIRSIDTYGFSLVEIMVVIGLVAIIGAGVTSLMSTTFKSQRGIQAKDQQRELTGEVRTHLSVANTCIATFGGLAPAPEFDVPAIKNIDGTPRFSAGTPDKSGLLMINKITLTNWLVDGGDPTRGNADVVLKLSKVGDTMSVKELMPDAITLRIKLAAGKIIDCYPIGVKTDGLWQKGTLNPNDIFYSVSSVGIGTSAPNAKLQVDGAITGKAATINAGTTIDFLIGNLQYTVASCGPFQLNNMKDGATYTFAIQGGVSSTCSFSAFSDAGTSPLTVHLPPDHAATTAATHTLYTFVVLGSHVYTAWIAGY